MLPNEDVLDGLLRRQQLLYDVYAEAFVTDTDSKFHIGYLRGGVMSITTPFCFEQSVHGEELASLCSKILDFSLDSEYEYSGTFWLESLRFITCGGNHHMIEILYDAYMTFLINFNDSFPRTLPKIFRNTRELTHAFAFIENRQQYNEEWIRTTCEVKEKVKTMRFVLVANNPEDEPQSDTDTISSQSSPISVNEQLALIHLV